MTHQNRYAIIAILVLLSAIAACASPTPAPTPQPAPTPAPAPLSLRIAYTSDSLGNIDPVIAVGCGWGAALGGLARRASAISRIRQERADALLVDAGNAWWGAPGLAEKSRGAIVVEAMNSMAYDAMALGAAELALGEPVLRQRIAEASFPVLSANVYVPSRGQLVTRPYTVLTVRGRRVGVIGLTGGDPISLPVQDRDRKASGQAAPVEFPAYRSAGKWVDDDLVVLDATQALARCLPRVHETADVIVVLSNLGWDANVRLAAQMPGIDVIISAGPGDLLAQPLQESGSGAFVCQGGAAGQEHPGELLAELFVQVDGAGDVYQCFGAETVLMPGMKNAPEIIDLVRKYRAQ